MRVNISLAAFPAMRHLEAAHAAIGTKLREPMIDEVVADHVQLVPQNFGVLEEETVDALAATFPGTRFRLHANVRVLRDGRVYDLSTFNDFPQHFARAAQMSARLRAPAYTAHAGRRNDALCTIFDAARRASDLFGCPVGVEGHYPERGNAATYFVSTWDEYRAVMESGVPYALDLSHLNIVAHYERRKEAGLVAEMLACERCIEVHLSDNDGRGDQHQVLSAEPWWWSLLPFINTSAVVFTEGNHRRQRAKAEQ